MTQFDILDFLKKNPSNFFSADEISDCTGLNKRTIYALLEKLKEHKEVEFKLITPKQGPVKKMYAFKMVDDYLLEIKSDYDYLKNTSEYSHWLPEHILLLIVSRELKILNKRVEHLEELHLPKKEEIKNDKPS